MIACMIDKYKRMRTRVIFHLIQWIRSSLGQQGEKAPLYKNYLYRLQRENQNRSLAYVCTSKSCPHVITLKNDAIIQCDATRHNHDPKRTEDLQNVFTGLKRRVITDVDQSIGKTYEEVKKFVSNLAFAIH
ncbi:unnamed protein product [Rotaria magnacalcarata]|uniref:FLYWCH-type domain-containing protein n=2 Tax=Rotaria magnacalcarata TaxID=392030 RepID=A0A816Z0X9_9BILA|nr:unnamed protein product [Rotaria magnacalcarata]